MKTTQVLVIGAGASGLMAGIMAARSGAKVVIAEQKDRPGRKILATGNGRCNFTNAFMDAACYHDNAFAMQVIRQFPGEQTLAFFRELGIYPVSSEGYYYPASMQASSVLAALLGEAERVGVKIMTYARVVSVSPAAGGEARSAAASGRKGVSSREGVSGREGVSSRKSVSGREGSGETSVGLHQDSPAGKETDSGFRVRIERTIPEGLQQKKKKNGKIRLQADSFRIEVEDWFCRKLILAGGGKAYASLGSDGSCYSLAESLGHHIVKPLPALTGIQCRETWFRELAGVRVEARVSIYEEIEAGASAGELGYPGDKSGSITDGIRNTAGEAGYPGDNGNGCSEDGKGCDGGRPDGLRLLASDQGQVQFTEYGISGIPVFQVSRYAAIALDQGRQVKAGIDFFPGISREDLAVYLREHRQDQYTGLYPDKLLAVLLKLMPGRLDQTLYCSCIRVNDFDKAQVTCGGIFLDEIDSATMESKVCPGLYIAGEAADVDGICGGYNLQWAWSSGYTAGLHAGSLSD